MSNNTLDDLKSYLNQLRDEDLIWVFHIFNEETSNNRNRYSPYNSDIQKLNKLKGIKILIIDFYRTSHEDDIYDFLNRLYDHKEDIVSSNLDYSQFENNPRFLSFACYEMHKKLDRSTSRYLRDIKNLYFHFLYLAYTNPIFYDNTRVINSIYSKYDEIYSKFNTHFKFENSEFFIWAKKYINENDDFRSYRKLSLDQAEYSIIINSIFDAIYSDDKNIHFALKRKISNAWYQKKHREDKKVKKAHHYYLSQATREHLKTLCEKYNLDESNLLESLINEKFKSEFISATNISYSNELN